MKKFIDGRKIGSGGFGDVYLCRRKSDDQFFAKKVLKNPQDKASVTRFVREVGILSKLKHPNIIDVVSTSLEQEPYYYVVPYYKRSLEDEFPQIEGDEPRIALIFTAILDAISFAHSRTAVHRDLKPENVLMNSDTDVVITDFGLGRMLDSESLRLTSTNASLGTPFYAAPEQLSNTKVADERSDIYSLGVILYRLYTGRFPSPDMSACPHRIRPLVERCLKHEPDQRFQTVDDLKRKWELVVKQNSEEYERRRIEGLSEDISAATSISPHEAEELVELLLKHASDGKMIHDILMYMTGSVVSEIFELQPTAALPLMERYVSHTLSESYAYDYVDKIGDFCQAIFENSPDSRIQALAVVCITGFAITHNRFKLQGMFPRILKKMTDSGDAVELESRMSLLDKGTIREAYRYICFDALPIGVRQAFENELLDGSARSRSAEELTPTWLSVLREIESQDRRLFKDLKEYVRSVRLESRTLILKIRQGEMDRFDDRLDEIEDFWKSQTKTSVVVVAQV